MYNNTGQFNTAKNGRAYSRFSNKSVPRPLTTTALAVILFFSGCSTALGMPTQNSHPSANRRVDAIVVREKPRLGMIEVEKWIPEGVPSDEIVLLGVRGYFSDQFGNDRNKYSSAFFLRLNGSVYGFRGNTLPSSYGQNPETLRYYPVLQPGTAMRYRVASYLSPIDGKRRPALVQDSPVSVLRDGASERTTGRYGIHIHSGGYDSTGSWGCQTIWPPDFAELLKILDENGVTNVRYILADRQ